jgi:hypothetical protein
MKVCAEQLEPLVKVLMPRTGIWLPLPTSPFKDLHDKHARNGPGNPRDIRKMISDCLAGCRQGGPYPVRWIHEGANAKDLLAQPDIDGGLVGGASPSNFTPSLRVL